MIPGTKDNSILIGLEHGLELEVIAVAFGTQTLAAPIFSLGFIF